STQVAQAHLTKRRLFEGCKVINMQRRVTLSTLLHVIDKSLKRRALRLTIMSPHFFVIRRATRLELDPTEKVMESALRRVAISLDVEEDISRCRLRKQTQSTTGLDRKQFEFRSSRIPRFKLEARLVLNSFKGVFCQLLRTAHHRQTQLAQAF